MKIFVKSAKLKFFFKEEGKFFNFSPTIRRIKNIDKKGRSIRIRIETRNSILRLL